MVDTSSGTPTHAGEIVLALRRERGLSQARLAGMAGVDPATISRLELGKITSDTATLEKIADGLGVPLARLIHGGVTGVTSTLLQELGAMENDDAYPSRAAFLEEFGDDLTEDEITHLRGHFFKSGDPGTAYWSDALLRYRKQERLMSKGRDIAQDAPPLSTGRTLDRTVTRGGRTLVVNPGAPPAERTEGAPESGPARQKPRNGKHSHPPAKKSKRPPKG